MALSRLVGGLPNINHLKKYFSKQSLIPSMTPFSQKRPLQIIANCTGLFVCLQHGIGKAVSPQDKGRGLRLSGQESGLDGPHVLQPGQGAGEQCLLDMPGKLISDFRSILMHTYSRFPNGTMFNDAKRFLAESL